MLWFIMKCLLGFSFLLFVLWYLWYKCHKAKEDMIRDSDMFRDAEKDWAALQTWFATEYPYKKSFVPFTVMVDTNGWAAAEVRVFADADGNLQMDSDLSPSEFILSVKKAKGILYAMAESK